MTRRRLNGRGSGLVLGFLIGLVLVGASATTLMAATPEFGDVIDFETGDASQAFGVIDGDRLVDAVYFDNTDPTNPAVRYQPQSASGAFVPRPGLEVRGVPQSLFQFGTMLAVADTVGADGRSDVVAGLVGAARTQVLVIPQGNAGFGPPTPVTVLLAAAGGRTQTGGAAGDVTGDGRADAVFTVSDGTTDWVVVVTAQGTSSRALPGGATRLAGGSLATVKLVDVTGDGVLDIVTGGAAGVGYATAAGGSVSGWQPVAGLPVVAASIADFAVGDLNGDGVNHPDFVIVQRDFSNGTGTFSLLLSRPGGAYASLPLTDTRFEATPCAAGAGDLNDDGTQDLVLKDCTDSGPLGSAITFLGDGNGNFVQPTLVARDNLDGKDGANIMDLNDDRFGDVLLTGGTDSNTVVYMNKGLFSCVRCPPKPKPPEETQGQTGDTRPPALRVLLRRRPWNPTRAITLRLGCDERCVATVSATVTFKPRGSRRATVSRRLPTKVFSLAAKRSARVTLRLHPSSRRLARRLLKRGFLGALTISIRATDQAGNPTRFKRVIGMRL